MQTILPTYIRRRNLKNLGFFERYNLEKKIELAGENNRLNFRDLGQAYNVKSSELKKLLIKKGKFSKTFFQQLPLRRKTSRG